MPALQDGAFDGSFLDLGADAVIDYWPSQCDRVVVGAVILGEDDCGRFYVLLLRRASGEEYADIDELPSGQVEAGESLREAVHREIGEETGMKISQVRRFRQFFEYDSMKGKTVQVNFLVVVDGLPTVAVVPSEHSGAAWVELQSIEETAVTPKVRSAIEELAEYRLCVSD